MLLFKTDWQTLPKVLEHEKHASRDPLRATPGEIILVQQNKGSLKKGQKSISWIMEYVSTYADTQSESIKIWGQQWPYIIQCQSVRRVEPFDINDLKISTKNYGPAMKYAWVDKSDEEQILMWLEGNINHETNRDQELELLDGTPEDVLKNINLKYESTPDYRETITKFIRRPSALRDAIIKVKGTDCQICNTKGFLKKNGSKYCELHHMIELNKLAPKSLQSWNILVLCPTCHKKMHYSNVESTYLNPGWKIKFDDETYIIN